jgi:hypothetical protein
MRCVALAEAIDSFADDVRPGVVARGARGASIVGLPWRVRGHRAAASSRASSMTW